ncbi:tetratricopeptide repeat protein [Hwanghaeella sp.]|uniref:tetratricopeptide repeat protein n=1 Tax=Hwanghaeella sp. TaxID=2605943 RepID=UPI003CCC2EE9
MDEDSNISEEARESSLKRAFDIALDRQTSGDFDGAIRAWRAILLQNPDSVAAMNNLGIALRREGRIAESEAVLRAGLEREPLNPELLVSLGQTRLQWGRLDEAEKDFIRASSLAPKLPGAHHSLGILYLERNRPEDAIRAFRAEVSADPGSTSGLLALSDVQALVGNLDEAAENLRRAVKLDPENRVAHLRIAEMLLLAGDYPGGFREMEWRWRDAAWETVHPDIPLWEGAALDGRTLLVDCDGGFSETLLLIRLLRPGGPCGEGRIIVRCRPSLVELLHGCRWLESVTSLAEPPPSVADVGAPLAMIPQLTGMEAADVPSSVPYLRPDPAALAPWRSRLPKSGVAVGVCWSGGEGDIPLAAFKPLAEIPGIHLVSLQKGEARREIRECGFDVLDLGAELDEGPGAFVDSAAVVHQMPLVVSTQTPIAHLAGALDRPVWVVLPHTPHWCFGLDDETTPWYPSARLFRPAEREPWSNVMKRLAQKVSALLG